MPGGDAQPIIEILRYDGVVWSQMYRSNGARQISDFQMLDDQTGWIAYNRGQTSLLFVNGVWRTVDFGLRFDFEYIDALQLLNASAGWAVGNDRLFSFDGNRWVKVYSPTSRFLTDLSMPGLDQGWAVGGLGMILHYDGSRWNELSSPTRSNLTSIRMYGPDLGWIKGDSALLRFNGSEWVEDDFLSKQELVDWRRSVGVRRWSGVLA